MNKKYNIVYNTENLINGKIYRGIHSTNNLEDKYLGSNSILCKAVKEYGRKNFKRTILFDYPTRKQASDKERELVTEEFCKSKETYNLKPGGDNEYTFKCSEEAKIKIRESNKKYHREHPGIWAGKNNPMYGKRGKNSPRYGQHHSKETKLKISKAKILFYKNNKEFCSGKNNPMYGRIISEETKLKRSKSRKRYYKNNNIRWINNGKINKMVKIEIAEKSIESGKWFYGVYKRMGD